MNATTLLRPGLLQGASLLLAGPPTPLAAAVARAFSELGARVATCLPDGEDEVAIDAAVAGALAEAGAIDMLIVDGAGLFHDGVSIALRDDGVPTALRDEGVPTALRDDGVPTALRACLDSAWNVTRAVVSNAFLPAGRGGRLVYIAPPANAGEHALAARAGLDNLARTLSVEWARHDINTIAIAPGLTTPAEQVAALAAYLASPAGAYFSGCLLDLGASGC
jgi:NAD(P)-dependent dehydrogenase (short-subunit alcohol dehydrogenase family)